MAKVVLKIGDQSITSIITADAVREMQLRKGQTAAALMKYHRGDDRAGLKQMPCLVNGVTDAQGEYLVRLDRHENGVATHRKMHRTRNGCFHQIGLDGVVGAGRGRAG